MSCGPNDVEIMQILFREQATAGTAETLTADDGKMRVLNGITPEYAAGRVARDISRATRTPIGSISGEKMLTVPFSSEVNTPDTFVIAATASLTVATIAWTTPTTMRYTFSGSPTLTALKAGMYMTCNYAANAVNNGTFYIISVGASYLDVKNPLVTSAASDETTGGICAVQESLEYQAELNCSGMYVKGMSRQAIGAVTSGPFTHGETITQAVSGATARVIVPCSNGDSYIYFEPLTDTPVTSQVWTGGSSGATVTPSSGPSISGYHVIPRSTCNAFGTVEYQEDGRYWKARDVMGTLALNIASSVQGFFAWSFMGPRSAIGDKAMTTGITRSTEDPPISQNVELTIDTFSPVASAINVEVGASIVPRPNMNVTDDTGIEGVRISGKRAGTITITCELEDEADFAVYTKLDAGTKVAVQGRLGTAETKQFWYFYPYVELDELPLGEIEKLRSVDITGTLTGSESSSGDDELEWAFIGN